jgi:probable O-glycosylation ligase (exosortase A-associated)
MLRALFVVCIIVYGLFQSFRSPFNALLFYLWIAYFRPEYWLWSDWVSQLNLSLIVGVFVVVATVLSGRGLRWGLAPFLTVLLLFQSFISTWFSEAFSYSWLFWQDFAKSTIISLLMVTLIDTEERLKQTFLVISASLGLEAVKQGWAQLVLNPGAINTNTNALLGDNNGVAVGMFMLVGFFLALARNAGPRYQKLGFRFAAIGTVYRGLSTFSRGGFLACAALGMHTLVRSRQRLLAAVGIGLVALLIVPVMSDEYWIRMQTISAATENADVAQETGEGRLHFWGVAVQMANAHPLTGIGHNAYTQVYDQYDTTSGDYGEGRAVHSSWFAILAELGYPGLFLFLGIILSAFWTSLKTRKISKRDPSLTSLDSYAIAIEGALVVFGIGGTFVTFQYTEMLWHTLALSMVVNRLVAERVRANSPEATPLGHPAMRHPQARIPLVPPRPARA